MIRMKAQTDLRKIGTLIIVVSVVLSVSYLFFHHQLVQFLELYFSSDHRITPNGDRELLSTFYFGMVLLLGIGLGFLKAQNASWRTKMRQVFLGEPLCRFTPVQPSPLFILIVSSLVGFLLIVNMRLTYRFPSVYLFLYSKDHGVLDLFVPVTMVISTALLSTAVWKLQKEPKLAKSHAFLSVVYLFMMGLFIFDAGEEASWGQDFLGWQTPSMFSGNIEGQTNLHNYFNTYFDYGYIALSLVLVIVLVSVWLEFNQRWLPFNRLFLPHPSLIGLSLLIAFVAIVWYPEQELLEEMIAVFVLFYSFRIFTCFRSKSLSIET
jgi:hypothetical protein